MAHTVVHFRDRYRNVHESDALGVVAIARGVVESDPMQDGHPRECVRRWLYEWTVCGVGCFRFFLDALGEDAEKLGALRTLLRLTDAKVASYGERIPASILNAALPQSDGSYFGDLPTSGVQRVIADMLAVLDAP